MRECLITIPFGEADFTIRMRKCVSEGSLDPAKSLAYALTHSGRVPHATFVERYCV